MKVLVGLFFVLSLYANSLDSILNKIEFNDDLSAQTKQESGGISYIITRYQLDMMQAKYLKDVLKSTVISDGSNRYNVLDPFSLVIAPFGNNNIKVYIDDYEITSMYSENATYLFSNLRLDFVDHIEIYYLSSADKYFSEPTFVTIKLYSKDSKRDGGLNLFGSLSSKYTSEAFSYANDNYFISASKTNVNDDTKVDNKKVYKNSDTYNIFAKLKIGDNNFIFNSIIDTRDAFLGVSVDAKPDKSYMENKNFYIGYERNFDKLKINYTLSYQTNKVDFAEIPMLIYLNNQQIYSIYNKSDNLISLLKTSSQVKNKNNLFNYGFLLKNSKKYNITQKINNQEEKYEGLKDKIKYTIFFDDTYQYLKNSVFNIGISYSIYKNNTDNKYYIKNIKLGNTYLYDTQNIFKLFYYHTETVPPNYIANSIFSNGDLKKTVSDNYILSYKHLVKNDHALELYALSSKSKDFLSFMGEKGIVNNSEPLKVYILDVRFKKYYNYINNCVIEYFKIFFDDIYNLKYQEQISLLNTHRYKKFDFFENIIYKKVTHTDDINDGIDLNLGIKYNANDNFSIALKGESLLSSRYENEYFRYDFRTRNFTTPVRYPTTPRNIVLSVEWSF